jgi:hypothetical protein
MLRALAGADPAWPSRMPTDGELEWLVKGGLGPLVHHLVPRSNLPLPDSWRERLQSVDLVARFEARRRMRHTEWALGLFRNAGIEATLLKGIAVATRYYPEPHLRAMGDVDLLIPDDAVPIAMQLLRNEGFTLSRFAEPEWWDTHHHAPPLIHPEREITIELHHRLLPPNAVAKADPPFDLAMLDQRRFPTHVGEQLVFRLVPECEFALLVAAWGNDLSIFLGEPGLQRPLVDAVLLLAKTGDTFDWERLARWTAGTTTGGLLWTLLTLLRRHAALPIRTAVFDSLRKPLRRHSRGTVHAAQYFVHRHVIGQRPFGRILTQHTSTGVLRTLMARRPIVRRWLAVPLNILFPPANVRRFDLAFQLRRIASMFKTG